MNYRQRYYAILQPVAVLDVLLADETNPRSLDFQLEHLIDLYEKLPRSLPADPHAVREALATLRRVDLQSMAHASSDEANLAFRRLDRSLAKLGDLLPTWSNNLSSQYFSHARTLPISME